MPKESLPLKLDPYRFADQAIRLENAILLAELPRLNVSLHENSGEVRVDLKFGVDEEGIRFMRGHIEAPLVLQCQRCMESLAHEVNSDFAFAVVATDEEAKALPERYDPVLTKEGMLNVWEVIEDELILNVPLVPMHHSQHCAVKLPFASDLDPAFESEKQSPFKVIELLRQKRDAK